jgi:hypothetical protein
MMTVLFGKALRPTTGFVSLLRLIGLDWAVPDFSTPSRRDKTLKVNIPYRGWDGPLHLLVDSAGIKVKAEGQWDVRNHGGAKCRVWRKLHIGIDERTLEILAAEFTTSDVGDAPCCPNRFRQSRRSAASPPMAPSIPACVMTPSQPQVLSPSFQPAIMQNCRNRTPSICRA